MGTTYNRLHRFVGEPNTQAIEGFAGFHVDQVYQLRYTRMDNGTVLIYLDHLPSRRQPLVVKAVEFEKWWIRVQT